MKSPDVYILVKIAVNYMQSHPSFSLNKTVVYSYCSNHISVNCLQFIYTTFKTLSVLSPLVCCSMKVISG